MKEDEKNAAIKVLLIEDNPDDSALIVAAMEEKRSVQCVTEVQATLSGGLERLSRGAVDVVLLDLGLPDSLGFETFGDLYAQYPDIPIIVLSGHSDEDLAIRTVQEGAQDYLVKGQFDGGLLARSIRYAIERHKIKAEIKSLSLIDDLTGLYNRRGFLTVAKQQGKVANRQRKNLLLIYTDMDNLKSINDTLGHQSGDSALKDIAEILNRTFRSSDVIGRIGGDEFAILGIEESEADFGKIRARLDRNIEAYSEKTGKPYPLSLSLGIIRFTPVQYEDLDQLMAKADELMYEVKQSKKLPKQDNPSS
jgi:two-component system, cell cycle response regulator